MSEAIGKFSQPFKEVPPSSSGKPKKENPIKRAGSINPYILRTRENYLIPESSKGKTFGHQAEFWAAESLKELPGFRDVLMSNKIEDSEKVDLTLIFNGGVRVPVQITTNPNKIKQKIAEVPVGTVVIYVAENDFEKVRGKETPSLTKKALNRIGKIIFSKMSKDDLQELMNVHGID